MGTMNGREWEKSWVSIDPLMSFILPRFSADSPTAILNDLFLVTVNLELEIS